MTKRPKEGYRKSLVGCWTRYLGKVIVLVAVIGLARLNGQTAMEEEYSKQIHGESVSCLQAYGPLGLTKYRTFQICAQLACREAEQFSDVWISLSHTACMAGRTGTSWYWAFPNWINDK